MQNSIYTQFEQQVGKNIIGQTQVIEKIFVCLICGGHVLLEGVPGVAKTLIAKTIAGVCDLDFSRIQFTPDLLPGDLIGFDIFNPQTHSFETKKGPIFSNIILADEINRAPAKVQSALLESMAEQQVTIGNTSYSLPQIFMVLATQNPLENSGTYELPEAQLDRFLMKINITYPQPKDEIKIMKNEFLEQKISKTFSQDDILTLRNQVKNIHVSDRIYDYVLRLATYTRQNFEFGISPRGCQMLILASKGLAFVRGKEFVSPDEVKYLLKDVWGHRVSSFDKENFDTMLKNIPLLDGQSS